MKLTKLLLLLAAIFTINIGAYESLTSQTIYLTRHAEKQNDGTRDPALNAKGIQRANNLVKVLQSKNIRIIFSTDYKRTQQTAMPLADTLGLKVLSYNPSKLAEFAQLIKSLDGNILVVGHSNTTPELVELLGGESHGKILETEYDRLYELKIIQNKVKTKLIRL